MRAVDADDFQSLRRAAHALVGSSLNAGAVRIATISRAIEQSEDGTRAQLETALETLDAELRCAAAAVSEKRWAGNRN